MRTILTSTLSAAFMLLAAGTPSAAGGGTLAGQRPEPTDPVTVVENFLVARDTGDPLGAVSWCAALLELQDVDGQWFVDTPTTVQWVRQLTDDYHINRLTPLLVEGSVVSWTERLTRRSHPFPEALHSSLSIDVHAVIREGKIAYLSGPYPPIPTMLLAPRWVWCLRRCWPLVAAHWSVARCERRTSQRATGAPRRRQPCRRAAERIRRRALPPPHGVRWSV